MFTLHTGNVAAGALNQDDFKESKGNSALILNLNAIFPPKAS